MEIQIDIVAPSVDEKEVIIGSCKYKKEPVGPDELALLKHYAQVFDHSRKHHYYIFSKSGFTRGLQESADRGEVTLVTLEDLYATAP